MPARTADTKASHPLVIVAAAVSKSKRNGMEDTSNHDNNNNSKSDGSTATATKTSSSSSAWDDWSEAAQSLWDTIRDAPERYRLKQDLILMGASYDRGFGASPSARHKVDDMIQELSAMNPCTDAARNIQGHHHYHSGATTGEQVEEPSPLRGNWRLVWTTAQDVLAMNASPFTAVGAIHQVVEPPIITNIVDLIPRAQELMAPDKIRSTLFRGKVTSRATADRNHHNNMMTVDLTFESVNIKAVEILGQQTNSALPALGFNLPKLPGTPSRGIGSSSASASASSSTRQVDILYLDKDMLITKQKSPGGTNVFVRVENAEV